MNTVGATRGREISGFELPIKDWLLYAFIVASPFYVFSVFLDRDWPALWVVLAMSIIAILEFFRQGGSFWIDRSFAYLLAFLAVYVVTALGMMFSDFHLSLFGRTDVDRALATVLRLSYVVFAYMVFVSFLANGDGQVYSKILTVQTLVGVGVALFGIIQYLSYVAFSSTALILIEPTNESYKLYSSFSGFGSQRFYRAAAFFPEPSTFGFWLTPFFVKVIVARAQGIWIGSKIFHWMAVGILVTAIMVNLSMTAILPALIVLFFFAAYVLRKSKHFWRFALLTAVGFSVILLTPAGPLALERLDRVFGLRDVSTLDRLFRVYAGMQVILESPFFGIGPGAFAFWYPRLGGLTLDGFASPLNIWVTFLTDVGILGFIPFLLFIGNILKRAIRASGKHPLISVYLWSVLSLLVLLTTLDGWFWETLWFECAVLVSLAGSRFLKEDNRLSTPA